MLPLIQHVTKVCEIHKDAKYQNNGLMIAGDPSDSSIKKQRDQLYKKDELRMYSNNINYVNEVQVKDCQRIKFDAVKVESDYQQQTKQNLETQYFLTGSGYMNVYEYLVDEKQSYVFFLEEFADLKALIPLEERHIQFKVRLSFSKIYEKRQNPNVENNTFEIKERQILGQILSVP